MMKATGTTHKSAMASLQSNMNIPIDTRHNETIDPNNCGIA